MFWRKRKTPRKPDFTFIDWAVSTVLTGPVGSGIKSYSGEMAQSMAYIALVAGAGIGYRYPLKVPLIYDQVFEDGRRAYTEFEGAISEWARAESTPSSDLNSIPIVKRDDENKDQHLEAAVAQLWAVMAFRYGCALGAAHPDLFKDLWMKTKENQRLTFDEMRSLGIQVPEAIAASEGSTFVEAVDEAAAVLERYESEFGPLPGAPI